MSRDPDEDSTEGMETKVEENKDLDEESVEDMKIKVEGSYFLCFHCEVRMLDCVTEHK